MDEVRQLRCIPLAINHTELRLVQQQKQDYKVGDNVMLQELWILRKMSKPYSGPCEVEQVFHSEQQVPYEGQVFNE